MGVVMDLPDENESVQSSVSTRDLNESIRIYQQVYQHVTGTTEKIKHKCTDNLLINMDEIKNVHNRIKQVCGMHNVISQNESVTVIHSRESKEQFTSFDRFSISGCSGSNPTISVIIKYNLAILPRNAKMPNHYQINVRLNSRIAMQNEMEEDAPPFIRGRLVTFMVLDAAEISVEYADYVVARGFIEAFKDWAGGCSRVSAKVPFIQRFQLLSHLFSPALRFLFSLLMIVYSYFSLSEYISDNVSNEVLMRFFILCFGAFFIIPSVAGRFGSNIERLIDAYVPPSYIILNKNDERLYEEYKTRNGSSILKITYNIISTIVLGVIACKLDRLL